MKKKLLTGVSLVLLLNFIIKPIWILGIDRTVQNVVGPAEYGFYYILFNFSVILNIILDFGTTNYNQRLISQSPHILNKALSRTLPLKLILSLVYAIVLFVVAFVMGYYDSRSSHFLAFLGFNQILASYILYMRTNITGLLMFKTDSVVSIMDKALMILFCSALLWSGVTKEHFRIEWFVYSQSAAYIITAIVVSFIVFSKTKLSRFSWNRKFLFSLIRQTFPYALLSLLMSFYYRIDSLLLDQILPVEIGKEQAGIYAMAYRILDVFSMASYMMSFFLLPVFARHIQQKEDIKETLMLSFSILITLSVIASASCSFYAQDLMALMYRNQADEAAHVFRIIIWGFIAISSSYVFGTLLTANGNLKQLNIVSIIGIVANLSVNFLLIPKLMAVGSAYASLAAQFSTAIVQIFIVRHIFKMKTNRKLIAKVVAFIAGTVLICYSTRFIPMNPFLNFGTAIAASLLWAVVLKIITPSYIRKMIKEG